VTITVSISFVFRLIMILTIPLGFGTAECCR